MAAAQHPGEEGRQESEEDEGEKEIVDEERTARGAREGRRHAAAVGERIIRNVNAEARRGRLMRRSTFNSTFNVQRSTFNVQLNAHLPVGADEVAPSNDAVGALRATGYEEMLG
jgi:hypothetical protein